MCIFVALRPTLNEQLLSREHTCTVHHAEATDKWHAAQVWTCAQVMWCGTTCLSAVRNPIHQLLVHQNKAVLRTFGSVHNLPQCVKQLNSYICTEHRAAAASVQFCPLLYTQVKSAHSILLLPTEDYSDGVQGVVPLLFTLLPLAPCCNAKFLVIQHRWWYLWQDSVFWRSYDHLFFCFASILVQSKNSSLFIVQLLKMSPWVKLTFYLKRKCNSIHKKTHCLLFLFSFVHIFLKWVNFFLHLF